MDAPFHSNLVSLLLQADTISFPPLEEREESMALADGFDFLGSSFMDSNTYVSVPGDDSTQEAAGSNQEATGSIHWELPCFSQRVTCFPTCEAGTRLNSLWPGSFGLQALLKAREQEPTVVSQMFIFISDIWLDSPQVMLFLGCLEVPRFTG